MELDLTEAIEAATVAFEECWQWDSNRSDALTAAVRAAAPIIERAVRAEYRPVVDKVFHIRAAFARSSTEPGAAELQQCLYELANMVDSGRLRNA